MKRAVRPTGIESIERDFSTEEPITLVLGTVLGLGEKTIDGAEYERRFALSPKRLLGYQHWDWLLANQHEHPAFTALAGKVYIDFPGIAVTGADGCRSPCVGQCADGQWAGGWRWLGRDFSQRGRVALSGK